MPPNATTRNPIGVGIIGLSASGGWAAEAHVPALAALDGFELRALAASSTDSAKAAGEKYGIPLAFGSVDELAQRSEIDLLVVAVKVPHHRELVLPALKAGKAVLCEWPLGNGLAEAQEMEAASRAAQVRTFTGLQARSAAPVRYLRDLVADGYVGDVLSTSIIASARRWGATVDTNGEYLLDHDNGGTMLTIPFGHTIDALTMTLGEFTEVTGTMATRRQRVRNADTGKLVPMTAEDQLAVTGVLDTGTVASLHFRGGLSRGTNFLWEINGTDGDLMVTGGSGHLQFGQVTIHGSRGKDKTMTELPIPGEYELAPQLADHRKSMAYTVSHAYAHIHSDLVHGTQHAPDFTHAVHRHRLLDHIQNTAIERNKIDIYTLQRRLGG